MAGLHDDNDNEQEIMSNGDYHRRHNTTNNVNDDDDESNESDEDWSIPLPPMTGRRRHRSTKPSLRTKTNTTSYDDLSGASTPLLGRNSSSGVGSATSQGSRMRRNGIFDQSRRDAAIENNNDRIDKEDIPLPTQPQQQQQQQDDCAYPHNTLNDTYSTTSHRKTRRRRTRKQSQRISLLRSNVVSNRFVGYGGFQYFFGFMFEEEEENDNSLLDGNGSLMNSSRRRLSRHHMEIDGSYYDADHPYDDDDHDHDNDEQEDSSTGSSWNMLNMALFVAYGLTSAATTIPILVVPRIGQEFAQNQNNLSYGTTTDGDNYDTMDQSISGLIEFDNSAFTSRCASCAVLGMACGKLLNAPLPDIIGARRISLLSAALLCAPLLLLAWSANTLSVAVACFLVEFVHSVQWPSIIVLLSVHYDLPAHKTQYESGVYITSIAARLGSVLSVPFFSRLLKHYDWRLVCLIGAWLSIVSSSVVYHYIMDTPTETDRPSNPLQPHLAQQIKSIHPYKKPKQTLITIYNVVRSIVDNNVWPSFRDVLKSWTFWIVAFSHVGCALILSSQRILGSYFYDTSLGYLSDAQSAGSLVIYLNLGYILGLAVAGNMFAHRHGQNRKRLVARLYLVTIVSCYVLSILSIPRLRLLVDSPDLVLFGQVVASICMGFGVAVMASAIPALASAAFSSHKGFFTSYVDGVAYGVASMVWRIVALSVESGDSGGGWAYGWAAVALLVVISAVLLIEFWSMIPAINGQSYRLTSSSTIRV